MPTHIDSEAFIAQLKTRRDKIGLREAANQIGDISASSLSRIENGKMPDIDTFLRICDWMGISPNTFIRTQTEAPRPGTPEVIEAHLRADRRLDETTAKAIAQMVRNAYELNKRVEDVDK